MRVSSAGPPNVGVGNLAPSELRSSPWPGELAVFEDGSIVVSDGRYLLGSHVGSARLFGPREVGPLFDNESTVTALAVDESDDEPILFVSSLYRVLRLSGRTVTTVAEARDEGGFGGDGGPGIGAGPSVNSIAVDQSGKIWFTDALSRRVRVLEPISYDDGLPGPGPGMITTVAGTGEQDFGGDGGLGPQALLINPAGLAVDSLGNVYIADINNARVRRVDTARMITTLAGTGERGYGGDDGPASHALLHYPSGVAVDGLGSVYIADAANHRVRMVGAASR